MWITRGHMWQHVLRCVCLDIVTLIRYGGPFGLRPSSIPVMETLDEYVMKTSLALKHQHWTQYSTIFFVYAGVSGVVRGCSISSSSTGADCTGNYNYFGLIANICYCSSDKCNGATRGVSASFMLIVGLVIAMTLTVSRRNWVFPPKYDFTPVWTTSVQLMKISNQLSRNNINYIGNHSIILSIRLST